ncbi:MAG: polymerase type B, organellar and viral family protein [candidate division TM6 bacterium GW2011_GWF2_33_332]|nr:MAG: polymerase type B, organellar and viral family protein [candidate division TM6 bacterium GW2011_GWF2_33_332]
MEAILKLTKKNGTVRVVKAPTLTQALRELGISKGGANKNILKNGKIFSKKLDGIVSISSLPEYYKEASEEKEVPTVSSVEEFNALKTISEKFQVLHNSESKNTEFLQKEGKKLLFRYELENEPDMYLTLQYTDTIGEFTVEENFFQSEVSNFKQKKITNITVEELNQKRQGPTFEQVVRFNEKSRKESCEIIDEDRRINSNGDNGFFPYFNTTGYDLSKYQVFNKKDTKQKDFVEKSSINCLIYALEQSGLVETQQLNNVKIALQTRLIPQRELNNIATIINRVITHRYVDKNTEKIVNVAYYLPNGTKTTKKPKDFKIEEAINTVSYKNHIFLYENTKYITIKTQKRKVKQFYTSFKLIKKIFKEGGMESMKLTKEALKFIDNNGKIDEMVFDKLIAPKKLETPKEDKPKKIIEFSDVYFADTEANINLREGQNHEVFLICWASRDNPQIFSANGPDCMVQFLNSVKANSLVYFHNMLYDMNFLMECPNIEIVRITEKNNMFYELVVKWYGKKIYVRDSYKHLPMGIKDLAVAFKLGIEKELNIYRAFNTKNSGEKYLTLKKLIHHVKIEKPLENPEEVAREMFEKARIHGAIYINEKNEELLDKIKYNTFYCEQDVRILRECMLLNNKFWKTQFNIDSDQYLTISSLSNAVLKSYHCFDDVFPVSGVNKLFIEKCIYGGVCRTGKNQKWDIKGEFVDFDAVSLYPSAMFLRDTFPKGQEKVLTEKLIKQLNSGIFESIDQAFMEVEITAVNNPMEMTPIMTEKSDESMKYGNEPGVYFIDLITLKDWIKYLNIEYKVIKGLYYNEGFNENIKGLVEKLFKLRKEFKAQKNNLQLNVKLMLNSLYGKTIQKSSKSKKTVFNNRVAFERFVYKNYNFIKKAFKFRNSDKYLVKTGQSIIKDENFAQVGATILSQSKAQMNEILAIARDKDIPIYYQDTDSLHLDKKNIEKLGEEFNKIYNRELIGGELGQYHSDFTTETETDPTKLYSDHLIILGKKAYIDRLRHINKPDFIDYHIRLKGIPQKVIDYFVESNGIDPIKLYTDLYEGNPVKFDLCKNGSRFKFDKNIFSVSTNLEFIREVKF